MDGALIPLPCEIMPRKIQPGIAENL